MSLKVPSPRDGERRMVTVLIDVPMVYHEFNPEQPRLAPGWDVDERFEAIGHAVEERARLKAENDVVHEWEDEMAERGEEYGMSYGGSDE